MTFTAEATRFGPIVRAYMECVKAFVSLHVHTHIAREHLDGCAVLNPWILHPRLFGFRADGILKLWASLWENQRNYCAACVICITDDAILYGRENLRTVTAVEWAAMTETRRVKVEHEGNTIKVGCYLCSWKYAIVHRSEILDRLEQLVAAKAFKAHACKEFPVQQRLAS